MPAVRCVVEAVATRIEHPVVREVYADRHYGADGTIVFTRNVGVLNPEDIAAKRGKSVQDIMG